MWLLWLQLLLWLKCSLCYNYSWQCLFTRSNDIICSWNITPAGANVFFLGLLKRISCWGSFPYLLSFDQTSPAVDYSNASTRCILWWETTLPKNWQNILVVTNTFPKCYRSLIKTMYTSLPSLSKSTQRASTKHYLYLGFSWNTKSRSKVCHQQDSLEIDSQSLRDLVNLLSSVSSWDKLFMYCAIVWHGIGLHSYQILSSINAALIPSLYRASDADVQSKIY